MRQKSNLLEREKTAEKICAELNNFIELKPTLNSIISNIKKITDCEAIGIRLHDRGDYPYFVYDGFSESFVKKESYLCAIDSSGNRIVSKNGELYVLECLCGNIIRGNLDAKLPFITQKGSYWSNNTEKHLKSGIINGYAKNIRGYCVISGYLSVALIPIKSNGNVIGLLQLNDKREGIFSKDLIEYIEMICEHIGMAVENSLIHEKLKENENLILVRDAIEKLKSEFFINISHEFRTPLNVILSTIQLLSLSLKDAQFDNPNNKNDRYLKIMKQNCYRLIRLVNNLLDITKIDSGYYKLELINGDIIDIVEKITLSVKEYIEHRGLKLNFYKNIDEKIIACDPEKIERIMLNILSNAAKFSNSGGTIKVTVNAKKDKVIISVKDEGVGIPKEKLKKIFERFKQIDNLITRNYEGCGIGLALVKSLVEMHGGIISVKSELGVGSDFIIEIPVCLVPEDNKKAEIKGYEDSLQNRVEVLCLEFSDIYE